MGAVDEYVVALRRIAREGNYILAWTPCCPACQEYGKEQSRVMAIQGKVAVNNGQLEVDRNGVLVVICDDCRPEPKRLMDDLVFWSRTGWAELRYVDS